MNAEEARQVPLPDGRTLEVRTAGAEDGEVVLLHHGTPGAGLPFEPMAAAAAARGLRLVMYSRPGYGASTAQPGRRVIDAAADTLHVVEALGASTFRTIGWSGGGPHALACAAALGGRCLATVTIAGVAPYPAAGLDWLSGMAPENVEEFGLALRGREALRPFLETFTASLTAVSGAEVAASLGGLVSPVDTAHLTGEFADWLAATFRVGLAHGIEGWCDDDLAFVADWGFDLHDCRGVSVWQGDQDRMVPEAHGRWLAEHLPGARSRLRPGQGHLSLALGAFEEILEDVLRPPGQP
jgi:pimeloyl-ACP methyl ester carboxylesterase